MLTKIRHHQICFFKLKMHQNPFSAGTPLGELTTLPQTPHSLFARLDAAFGVSNLFSEISGPLNTFWLRHASVPENATVKEF